MSNWVRLASGRPGRGVPASHRLSHPAGHRIDSTSPSGEVESCIRRGVSGWPPTREESAALAAVIVHGIPERSRRRELQRCLASAEHQVNRKRKLSGTAESSVLRLAGAGWSGGVTEVQKWSTMLRKPLLPSVPFCRLMKVRFDAKILLLRQELKFRP